MQDKHKYDYTVFVLIQKRNYIILTCKLFYTSMGQANWQ